MAELQTFCFADFGLKIDESKLILFERLHPNRSFTGRLEHGVAFFFICAHFFMRIANVTFFLFSLTVCAWSIFGGEPDIKVPIFYGYSSPDFKGEVLKNTQQSIESSLAPGHQPPVFLIPSSPSLKKNKQNKINSIMTTPCGVRQTVGSNAGQRQSAGLL